MPRRKLVLRPGQCHLLRKSSWPMGLQWRHIQYEPDGNVKHKHEHEHEHKHYHERYHHHHASFHINEYYYTGPDFYAYACTQQRRCYRRRSCWWCGWTRRSSRHWLLAITAEQEA